PGFEHAVEFEAKIVVQPRGSVFLHDKAQPLRGRDRRGVARFGSLAKIPLAAVGGELGLAHEAFLASRGVGGRFTAAMATSCFSSLPPLTGNSICPWRRSPPVLALAAAFAFAAGFGAASARLRLSASIRSMTFGAGSAGLRARGRPCALASTS